MLKTASTDGSLEVRKAMKKKKSVSKKKKKQSDAIQIKRLFSSKNHKAHQLSEGKTKQKKRGIKCKKKVTAPTSHNRTCVRKKKKRERESEEHQVTTCHNDQAAAKTSVEKEGALPRHVRT